MYFQPFQSVVPVLSGLGVSQITGTKLKELGCTKVMMIFDKGVEASPVPAKIIDLIKAEGIEVITENRVEPDAPDVIVDAIAERAHAEGVDGIVGIGGGSSLDTAKAVNLLLTNPGKVKDYFDYSIPQNPGKPLILIPTTSGTGTECVPGAVITDTEAHLKTGIAGMGCFPSISLVDAELCVGVPQSVTAACAFDALAHAIEGITSKRSSGTNQALCREAIRLVKDNLLQVYYNGSDVNARDKMHQAANLGGVSISNAGGELGHGFAHSMGALFHLSHGLCCALTTPACLEYNAVAVPDEVRMIAETLGIPASPDLPIEAVAKAVACHIVAMAKSVDLPLIKEVIPNKEDAYKLIPMAKTDMTSILYARELTDEGGKWIIDKMYEY